MDGLMAAKQREGDRKENMKQIYSWSCYLFLIISVLLSISIFSFFVLVGTSEMIIDTMIKSSYLLVPASIIMAVVSLTKKERTEISKISLLLTIVNLIVVRAFLCFGANFAPKNNGKI
ncbi:hypothetical protein J6TS1_43950 [Siminovitchia terrae]|uniref:Uncharacterized protein n=1 Tax=Siminovitchia terrae TaxID=1914933 RepID=A0A429XAI7_SIMTE|nr:hypothetical protein [Siminovitchia terrae]RST60420.1 hypothetical protein D5F11_006155 [Siminovitchia terrae]GIN98525.1 hypothetical protein J6TS1_43950 [Siminovitchia terrae]